MLMKLSAKAVWSLKQCNLTAESLQSLMWIPHHFPLVKWTVWEILYNTIRQLSWVKGKLTLRFTLKWFTLNSCNWALLLKEHIKLCNPPTPSVWILVHCFFYSTDGDLFWSVKHLSNCQTSDKEELCSCLWLISLCRLYYRSNVFNTKQQSMV